MTDAGVMRARAAAIKSLRRRLCGFYKPSRCQAETQIMLQLEVPIHVLLVLFQAMKHCGHALPTISEDVQETCLQRLTATMQFTGGVPPDFVAQMITKFCVDHPERYLLAFVYGHLGQHDLLRVRTDAEKFLLLAALNLVECVAYVGAQLQSK
ncbi:hypothetical protein [Variovorax sp. V116]|uniref:hypothetical protein n=1 Tax=Variovorax sp. V116 TaxID=3065953 RepID=UPI0034E8DECD